MAVGGGGVSSRYDPLDVTEYTFEEMNATGDVVKTWNTYVMVTSSPRRASSSGSNPAPCL